MNPITSPGSEELVWWLVHTQRVRRAGMIDTERFAQEHVVDEIKRYISPLRKYWRTSKLNDRRLSFEGVFRQGLFMYVDLKAVCLVQVPVANTAVKVVPDYDTVLVSGVSIVWSIIYLCIKVSYSSLGRCK